jgi:S-adenosylmethionine decarboxylase
MNHWGKHLILNCKAGNKNVLCKNAVSAFNTNLVKAIDMKAYGAPQVYHFGEDNKKGLTSIQLIETSNITGHFCDDSKDFYLDVFSCKDYNVSDVIRLVKETFQPENIESHTIYRDARNNKYT